MSAEDVLVVGGGITGLALATALVERGRGVRVLEATDRAGGNLRTQKLQRAEGSWLLDLGPNSFGENATDLVALAESAGVAERIVRSRPSAQRRLVWRNNALRQVSPLRLMSSGLLPPGDRLRLLGELFVAARRSGPEETLAAFCDRRLGRAAREKLLTPVVGGIYAGDPEELGAESAFPAMVALEREYGSLIRAAIRGKGPPSRGTPCSFRGGMAELTDAVARRLGGRIVTGARVTRLEREGASWRATTADGRTFAAAQVVLTTPAFAAGEALAGVDPELARELAAIPYAPMAVVHVGVRRGALLRATSGFGFLVPRNEGLRILGAIYSSELFDERASAGYVLVTIFTGGRLDPEAPSLPDRTIRDYVVADLRRALRLADQPLLFEVTRWPRAIPQYVVGHKDRIARIDAATAKLPGLTLLGNWKGGIAMPDCVRNAKAAAARL